MIKLIVGLGNPGQRYENTRHNAGVWLIQACLDRFGGSLREQSKLQARLGDCQLGQRQVRLMCPTTYMNHSGLSVSAVAKFYKIAPEEICVVHDELDFLPGEVRLKQAGGHGGHNGLRDIMSALSSDKFYRIRIGIGHPGEAREVSDYVLRPPSKTDQDAILRAIDDVVHQVSSLVSGDWSAVQKQLHSK